MTAHTNWGDGGQDDDPDAPRDVPHRARAEPPALQIKMPERTGATASAQPGGESDKLEFMLQRLMERLDDSERRYGEALDDLHGRLDHMAPGTGATRGDPHEAESAGGEVGTVDDRARELAERLREGEAASADQREDFSEIERRISAFAEQMAAGDTPDGSHAGAPRSYYDDAGRYDQGAGFDRGSVAAEEHPAETQSAAAGDPFAYDAPNTDAEPQHASHAAAPEADDGGIAPQAGEIDRQFAAIAQQFERSVAATVAGSQSHDSHRERQDSPGAGADMQNAAPSQASQAPQGDPLASIEARLAAVAGCLERGEEQHRRLEAMERDLARLVATMDVSTDRIDTAAQKAAQETVRLYGGDRDRADSGARLDAIQEELRTLNARARDRDERMVNTVAAMHETLQGIASRIGLRQDGGAHRMQTLRQEDAPAPPAHPARHDDDARLTGMPPVAADYAAAAPHAGPEGAPQPHAQPHMGAAIPDYPPPSAPAYGRDAPTGDAAQAPEARADGGGDLIAAARRAAQAAARRSQEPAQGAGMFTRARPSRAKAGEPEADGQKPRRLLVFAAIFLLLVSAALLYSRLNSRPEGPASAPAQFERIAPPAEQQDAAPPPSAPAEDAVPGNTDAGDAVPGASPGTDSRAPAATERERRPAAITDVPRSLASYAPTDRQPSEAHGLGHPGLPGTSVQLAESQAAAPAAPAAAAALDSVPSVPARSPEPPRSQARSDDLPEAIGPQALRNAALQGDPRAQFEIAAAFAAGRGVERDHAAAARWYERAAAQGLAPAQFRLASLYERGHGAAQDNARAKVWYERAAKQGNINAMHNLAVMHTGRDGEGPDYAAAAKWFDRAAAHGLADSKFNLGILYENGLGVRKNLSTSYKWFVLAGAGGDAEANRRAALIKPRLSAEAVERAEAEAKAWSAAAPDPEANGLVDAAAGDGADAIGSASQARGDPAVAEAQGLLKALGYDAGPADGILGPKTRQAVRAFEQRAGFAPTGEITPDLLAALQAYSS